MDIDTVVSASSDTVAAASRVHRLSTLEQWTLCAYQVVKALAEQMDALRQVCAHVLAGPLFPAMCTN